MIDAVATHRSDEEVIAPTWQKPCGLRVCILASETSSAHFTGNPGETSERQETADPSGN